MQPVNPLKSDGAAAKRPAIRVWGAVFVLLGMLISVQGLSCASPSLETALPSGETLSPIMNRLRLCSRDFKRALVLENENLYIPTGRALVVTSQELIPLQAPSTFTLHIDALNEKTEALLQAAQDTTRRNRLNAQFGEVVGACSDCHNAFRK